MRRELCWEKEGSELSEERVESSIAGRRKGVVGAMREQHARKKKKGMCRVAWIAVVTSRREGALRRCWPLRSVEPRRSSGRSKRILVVTGGTKSAPLIVRADHQLQTAVAVTSDRGLLFVGC
ncbi:hypothetical protein chiPu_0004670 [Chiloscyllium punctatum]|uniref:Uncharacterized protein n=1 Tax=Chiloscyllium punctatum TaxID=137246 RepID=A0A401S777_CHIPU|nr:hypothetical protein [Chiloscyllium punctatum]